jgi:RNA polymerase sigma-70 factor (sigma-E family)
MQQVAGISETRGVESRLARLYQDHALAAVRLAYLLTGSRELAEDLVQEAFLRISPRLETLREEQAFPGYLRKTVLNLARAHFRRQRLERLTLRKHASISPRLEAAIVSDIDLREELWRALQRLPHRQRAALVLRYYEDLSTRDAAALLGTSVGAVKLLVSRGTQALRGPLEAEERRQEVE